MEGGAMDDTASGALEPKETTEDKWRYWFRAGGATVALIWIGAVFLFTLGNLRRATAAQANAIQITQLYAGAIFFAVIPMGLCMALYVLSRAGE
jgi:hypothetical protein